MRLRPCFRASINGFGLGLGLIVSLDKFCGLSVVLGPIVIDAGVQIIPKPKYRPVRG